MSLSLDRLVCIDFEASSLGKHSYPIEVGLADPATGEVHSWLIKPQPRWLAEGEWHPESARVHGITQAQLSAEGQHPWIVYTDLLHVIEGREVVSDNPDFDDQWFRVLIAAALADTPEDRTRLGEKPPIIHDLDAIAWSLAVNCGRTPEIAWQKAELEACLRFPFAHRAGADARHNAEMLRQIAGLSPLS